MTVYYVLLNDGGSNGVRFGCNDSLVGMQEARKAGVEPLPAAINALLAAAPDISPSSPQGKTGPDMYNALAASRLTFLSGTFDGTTVTVYLSGSLNPGGVCDVPRLEAQLTQTAVASVGAVRAEVYVNGQRLADALRLDGQ